MFDQDTSGNRKPFEKAAAWLLTSIFLLCLILPTVDKLASIDPVPVLDEYRRMEPWPNTEPTVQAVREFPRAYEKWYQDRFGLRNLLVTTYARIRIQLLGLQPKRPVIDKFWAGSGINGPDVTIGKEDWLFYTGDGVMNHYRGILGHFNQERIETVWAPGLDNVSRIVKEETGAEFLYVIVPDKQTLYPEFMPDEILRLTSEHNLDRFEKHISDHPSDNIVLLKAPMLAAKNDRPLFYKTDTHWNQYGVYIGYSEIVNGLQKWFPDMKPQPMEFFNEIIENKPGDIERLMGLPFPDDTEFIYLNAPDTEKVDDALEFDGYIQPHAWENENKELPVALVFGDSFAWHLVPSLSHHFSRLVFYQNQLPRPEIMEREKPDVIIHLIAERQGSSAIPDQDIFFDLAVLTGTSDP